MYHNEQSCTFYSTMEQNYIRENHDHRHFHVIEHLFHHNHDLTTTTSLGVSPSTIQTKEKDSYNILCLDGGGMRGLVQCEMLKSLHRYCHKKPVHELFDMVVGVGAGSILACLIAQQKDIGVAIQMYDQISREIFSRKSVRGVLKMINDENKGKYNSKLYRSFVENTMGSDFLLNPMDPDPKLKLVVLATELDRAMDSYETVLFRNYKSRYQDRGCDFENIRTHEAIDSSTAAPFYMDAVQIGHTKFVGGGVVNNNPTFQAILEARAVFGSEKKFTIVNLGTGEKHINVAEQALNTIKSKGENIFPKKKKTGITLSASRLISVSNDCHRICEDVEKYLVSSCEPGQISCFRFSPPEVGQISIGTHDPEKLNFMLNMTKHYVRKNSFALRRCANCLISVQSNK